MCRYKIAKEKREALVRRTAQARLPTEYGEFQVHSYEASDGLEHAALVVVTHLSSPFFWSSWLCVSCRYSYDLIVLC